MKKKVSDLRAAMFVREGIWPEYVVTGINAATGAGIVSEFELLDPEKILAIRDKLRDLFKTGLTPECNAAIEYLGRLATNPNDKFWRPLLVLEIPLGQEDTVKEMEKCVLEAEIVKIGNTTYLKVAFPRNSII